MKLSQKDRCQLRDWSLWDDEVACATMNAYISVEGNMPNLFYAGTCFMRGSDGDTMKKRATTLGGQVDLSIKEELHHLIEEELYKLPGFKP